MDDNLPAATSDFLLYRAADGDTHIQVRFSGQTVWLTQKQMAELFQKDVRTINEHIQNIFDEGELLPEAVIRKFRITAADGKTYETQNYNLDVIIAVGYRVKSHRGTQFRIWATQRLREYIIKGFVLDDERLKSGKSLRQEYFDELLERIRDIRASERLFYQKITDIYAQCSVDYDPDSDTTKEFYATVQNKLHWAIHGHTAAEVIAKRANASKPYMGLTTWKNSPKGKIRKSDVAIAKNYLTEIELRQLNRIITMYLDYAEMQAENRRPMTMTDWTAKLDAFLKFNEKDVLTNPGKISADVARELAEKEFGKYERQIRKIEATEPISDFDKLVERTKKLEKKILPKKKEKRANKK
jgi:hypothetical protein